MTEKEAEKLIIRLIDSCDKEDDVIESIESTPDVSNDDIELLKVKNAEIIISSLSSAILIYPSDISKNPLVQYYIKQYDRIKNPTTYFKMVYCFLIGNEIELLKCFDAFLDECKFNDDSEINEFDLYYLFIEPFKNYSIKYLNYAKEKLVPYCKKDGTDKLLDLMISIYTMDSEDEMIDLLIDFSYEHPSLNLPNEILAGLYSAKKLWHNAIARFESVKEYNFYGDNVDYYYFDFALACYNAKLYSRACKHYRKSLEINPRCQYSLNNLGFSLLKQKNYIDALEIFQKCIDEKRDFPNALNGYAKTLIALGRNNDAKEFAKHYNSQLPSSLLRKINSLDSTNKRIAKKPYVEIDDNDDLVSQTNRSNKPSYQFSSEKILEDELTNRIESGNSVFGLELKMYRRKGVYGRQFRTDVGIVDLLCEDDNSNLYIIELKKDKGYDDPYVQTVRYLDWFEQQTEYSKNKIFGIICLSNPSKKLLDDVRSDDRIRLFEYSISYAELK